MKDIIELYKNVVIQIATPYSIGTGFYLQDYNIVVTNEHVVRGNKEVVIQSRALEKRISKVLYADPKYDLAFLEIEGTDNMPRVSLGNSDEIEEGDSVIAIGNPFGLSYTTTQGIISKANRHFENNDVSYIQIDAAINPGNSGGPLINEEGQVIGINSFITRDSNNLGFALPSNYLAETITEFLKNSDKVGTRCTSCLNLVFENTIDEGYCPHCGSKVELSSDLQEYEPTGIPKIIEEIISKLGYDVDIARRGPNGWGVEHGSAKVRISYHQRSGIIVGDTYLCRLPKKDIKPIYEYMLRQNNLMEGMGLSLYGQNIVLSVLIMDRYLNVDTGMDIFKYLFEKADFYDNVLVEQYGAIWLAQDKE